MKKTGILAASISAAASATTATMNTTVSLSLPKSNLSRQVKKKQAPDSFICGALNSTKFLCFCYVWSTHTLYKHAINKKMSNLSHYHIKVCKY